MLKPRYAGTLKTYWEDPSLNKNAKVIFLGCCGRFDVWKFRFHPNDPMKIAVYDRDRNGKPLDSVKLIASQERQEIKDFIALFGGDDA